MMFTPGQAARLRRGVPEGVIAAPLCPGVDIIPVPYKAKVESVSYFGPIP